MYKSYIWIQIKKCLLTVAFAREEGPLSLEHQILGENKLSAANTGNHTQASIPFCVDQYLLVIKGILLALSSWAQRTPESSVDNVK